MTNARIPLLLAFGLLLAGSARAQNPLDAPAAPDNTDSAMYSLEDLYNRLNTGAAGTDPTIPANATRTFGEPDAGPTGATMYSLDAIMGKMPVMDDINGATAAEVLNGKKFWGLRTGGGWGMLTGTYTPSAACTGTAVAGDVRTGETFCNSSGAQTGSLATRELSHGGATGLAGYYEAITLTDIDSDLVSGNIKSGITIFGITGDTNVVDTSSGDAGAGDILSDKKAWVDGSEVTGTMPDVTSSQASTAQGAGTGTIELTAPAGYYDGSDKVTATDDQVAALDSDLTPANVKKDVAIFGVTGTYEGGSAYPAPVPATGQMSTVPINPAPAGSDGALGKGVAWPTSRFTNNSDGTVTDNLTGLIWLQNANCANATRNWENALTDVTSLNSAGTMNNNNCGDTSNSSSHQVDWRLPNLLEMQSLIDYGQYEPALPSGYPFSNAVNDFYWTSTTRAIKTESAWLLGVGNGFVRGNPKSYKYYVWPVRGGQ